MKKLKLPSLLSLAPQSKSRKPMNKLQAHASRLTQSAYDDYEEPTTKLSTAFVVVLVLHLVAVGGIYAFHSIKAKRREADGTFTIRQPLWEYVVEALRAWVDDAESSVTGKGDLLRLAIEIEWEMRK